MATSLLEREYIRDRFGGEAFGVFSNLYKTQKLSQHDLDWYKKFDSTAFLEGSNRSNQESAFVAGLEWGLKHTKADVQVALNKSDYGMQKDITIVYDYCDNDFGLYMEHAGEKFCELYNKILSDVDLYNEDEFGRGFHIRELELLEKLENIQKVLSIAFIESFLAIHNDVSGYSEIALKDHSALLKEAVHHLDYIEISNTAKFFVGTYEEAEKYVLEKYKECQSEGEGTSLENIWANGEVLFIVIKDGFAKTFTR